MLTARAAVRIPAALGKGDADQLVASMLSAGLDHSASRWLGVVDRGSLGAVSGQVLTALALVVFSLEVSSVPSGWRVLRRRAN